MSNADQARKLAQDFRQAFGTPAGEKVLSDLRAQFYDRDLYHDTTPESLAVRVGEHRVVRYILDMMEHEHG